jgi:hypothetical protein
MKTNTARVNTLKTHEGAPAKYINAEAQLKRSVLSCMLFENEFYEDGKTIAARITELAGSCSKEFVASLAVQARNQFNLRHVPLLLLLSLIKRGGAGVAEAIFATISRADELSELVALYWKYNPEKPLSKQMKLGLAKAFGKFNEYQFAKYNRKDSSVRLRDVLFLCHAKPTKDREDLYKRLANNQLENPDTWESRMAGGENKKEVFTDLLARKKLGYLALLRNLRGMNEAGVDHALIKDGILTGDHSRVLPFRFIAAARHAPMFEPQLDTAMVSAMADAEKLKGKTVLLVDVSGSMDSQISAKSDLKRCDAAAGLAILLAGICDDVRIFIFGTTVREVPARKGMALRDLVAARNEGTFLGLAIGVVGQMDYDRLVVITDEQSHDRVPGPKGRGYMLNVASARNGVGYGPWVHIDGFSEACVAFIREYENQAD